MSEDQIQRLEVAIESLKALLGERCANHQTAIKKNKDDIDQAFDKIRSVKEMLHSQDKILARWSVGASLLSALMTAAAVKFFVG